LIQIFMKILFLMPYPKGEAPSQRFRFEQYFHAAGKKDWTLRHQSFLTHSDWLILYSKGHTFQKLFTLVKGYSKRLSLLYRTRSVQYVFIHRETVPVGPPVFEWIIAKVFRKKIIYDFDDAIWLTDKTNESCLEKALRWRSKVASICRWSYKVSCGNAYLADYARQLNPNVVVNPTTIDTEALHNPELFAVEKDPARITIGWTGSHSTLKYLETLTPVLQHLEEKYNHVDFLLIADRNPQLPLNRVTFIPWSKESEARDLMKMDIGIMPLPDDAWTRGKCGFKALQYMAMEVPCVASPVGVNSEIVRHGETGYLAHGEHAWIECLEKLINDARLRIRLGKAGRQQVIRHYSVVSNTARFLSLFDQ
jgi:glycosyltransferase involved in cell wall biosynthesis